MRILLLLALAACGKVTQTRPSPDAPPAPVDAVPVDAPVDADPISPDGAALCRTETVVIPTWTIPGPFVKVQAGVFVWIATGQVPALTSFDLPVTVGWRIVGFSFGAYGNGSDAGLLDIRVLYQPDPTTPAQVLARGQDLGRKADWGVVELPGFSAASLTGGRLWVTFTATEQNYYIDDVTPVFERPCGP